LPDDSQTPKLSKRCFDVFVSAYFITNSLQVMIQAEMTRDEILVCTRKLQFSLVLPCLEDSVSNNAVPPIALFVPPENLSATKRNVQIKGNRAKLHGLSFPPRTYVV
jgi:hypothetical protein